MSGNDWTGAGAGAGGGAPGAGDGGAGGNPPTGGTNIPTNGGGAPTVAGNPPAGGGGAPTGAGSEPAGGDWRSGLPEELRGDPSVAQHKDIASLVKSFVHAQSLIGRKGIIPPGEDATPEQLAQFFDALGRPKSHAEYQLEAKGLPEGMKINDTITEAFKAKAHELGFTPKQAAGLFDWYSTQVADMHRAGEERRANAPREFEAFIAKEYGMHNAPAVMQQAGGVLRAFADEDVMKGINDSGLANEPWFFKLMHKIGSKFSEGSGLRGDQQSSGFMQTPAQATAELSKIMGDPNDVYWSESDPGREARIQHVMRLQKVIADAAG